MKQMKKVAAILAVLISTASFAACGSAPEGEDPGSVEQALSTYPVWVSNYNLSQLQLGDYYEPFNVLRWNAVTPGRVGGSSLSAAHKSGVARTLPDGTTITATMLNDRFNTPGLAGQCVSFVKALATRGMPATAYWEKGANVLMGNVPVGTVIATFRNGVSYDQGGADHTAIFAGYTGGPSIWVYDQNWFLDGIVRYHTINVTNGTGPTNAAAYYVVKVP